MPPSGHGRPAPHRFVAHVIEEAANKIHDDDVAQQFGFTGALVPGVELFARITTPLVEAWGEEWLAGGRVDVRFRRPVYDGEELLVEVADGGALTATGPDGEVRCLGSAARTAERPDLTGLVEVTPADRLVADPVVGPFPSVHEDVTVEQNDWYLDAAANPWRCTGRTGGRTRACWSRRCTGCSRTTWTWGRGSTRRATAASWASPGCPRG